MLPHQLSDVEQVSPSIMHEQSVWVAAVQLFRRSEELIAGADQQIAVSSFATAASVSWITSGQA